jgi:UDP:flavonoid glycosyltransferase YjiC (YdhE family)
MATRDAQTNSYQVIWPRAQSTKNPTDLAKRYETLNGKTIAQLWDYVFRGDEIFPILEEELMRRFPEVRFINYSVFGSTHGAEEREILANLPETLKQLGADAVISGMGC